MGAGRGAVSPALLSGSGRREPRLLGLVSGSTRKAPGGGVCVGKAQREWNKRARGASFTSQTPPFSLAREWLLPPPALPQGKVRRESGPGRRATGGKGPAGARRSAMRRRRGGREHASGRAGSPLGPAPPSSPARTEPACATPCVCAGADGGLRLKRGRAGNKTRAPTTTTTSLSLPPTGPPTAARRGRLAPFPLAAPRAHHEVWQIPGEQGATQRERERREEKSRTTGIILV